MRSPKLNKLAFLAALTWTPFIGCSHNSETAETLSQALTLAQQRVFGFESPTSDWHTTSGTVSVSTTHSEGAQALDLASGGYAEIYSVAVAVPGVAASEAGFDLRLPAVLGWGEARVILKAPSAGVYWLDLGAVQLAGLPAGTFQHLKFAIPSSATFLAGNAQDMEIRIVLNAQPGKYQIDNFSFAASTATPGKLSLSISVPAGQTIKDSFMAATSRLTIDDRSTLGADGALEKVSNVGKTATELGAGVQVHADVKSVADVAFLRSAAHIYGAVTSAGRVLLQNDVAIDGGSVSNAVIQPVVTSWDVAWPKKNNGVFTLSPDAANVDLAPGAYSTVQIFSRATVTLGAGAYYFDSLQIEPQAHFRLRPVSGPVLIYVKSRLVINAPVEYIAGDRGQAMFGYLGTDAAVFQQAFVGTVVAPNAAIELRRPDTGVHEGSFFGKDVHVFSDATVKHLAFNFAFLCAAGDTDGDGTLDCYEECPNDPLKREPGLCGCGVADADSDGDGMPDCLDGCKLAASTTYRGQCGCPGETDLAPAGKTCMDSLGVTPATCDASGLCGDPMTGAPEAGCTWKTIGSRAYWFCPAATASDAAKRCAGQAGGRLVQIDTQLENLVVARFVAAPSFIGATDRTQAGEWTWQLSETADGRKFWTGGNSGHRYHGYFASFSGGVPSQADGKHCATIDKNGRWTPESCGASRPYVCESPFGASRNPGPGYTYPVYGPEHFYPGWSSSSNGGSVSSIPEEDCVPYVETGLRERPEWGGRALSDQTVEEFDCGKDCGPNSTKTKEECKTICKGIATPPPEGSHCSDPGEALSQIELLVVDGCTVEHPDCSVVSNLLHRRTTCGVQTRCLALTQQGDGTWVSTACSTTADCAAGQRCDAKLHRCVDPDLTSACDRATRDEKTGTCHGQCFSEVGCGVRVRPRGVISEIPDRDCSETRFCASQPVYTAGVNDTNLKHEDVDPSRFPDLMDEPAPDYSTDFTSACGAGGCQSCSGRSGPGCARESRHPWCNAGATLPASVDPSKDVPDERTGDRGTDSSLVKFEFTPSAHLNYHFDPQPFGVAKYDLLASAAIRANASFNVASIKGNIELLDLRAQLRAELCRVSTKDSHMEILGYDFLPGMVGNSGLLFDTADKKEATEKCKKAVDAYVDAVDRAKKAMRDAQELVRQFQELQAKGTSFDPTTFCKAVAGAGVRPKGMPGWNLADPCANEKPWETINQFIAYYENQVAQIPAAIDKLAKSVLDGKTLAEVAGLEKYATGKYGYEFFVPMDDLAKGDQTTTLMTLNFFIGPIPCNLEASSYVNYGIGGGLGANLDPGVLVTARGEFARAGAVIVPHASAGVTLFVGAGFDCGPLSLKVGLQGTINLASIELPATAAAGLSVNSEAESRSLPSDLSSITDGRVLFPPGGLQRYNFQFVYDYGIDLTLYDILSGKLEGAVEVSFFFFSQKWTQTLAQFSGLPKVTYHLLGSRSDTPEEKKPAAQVASDTSAWTSSYDSVPFVGLTRVSAPADSGQPASGTFDNSRASHLFYDTLCQCAQTGKECERRDDCCDTSQVCFSNPTTPGKSECSACRQWEDPTSQNPYGMNQSCNQDSDCCGDSVCNWDKVPANCVLIETCDNSADYFQKHFTECVLCRTPGFPHPEECPLQLPTGTGYDCDLVTPPTKRCHRRPGGGDVPR